MRRDTLATHRGTSSLEHYAINTLFAGKKTWAGQDSNLRPTDYESAALTAELPARSRGDATTASRDLPK